MSIENVITSIHIPISKESRRERDAKIVDLYLKGRTCSSLGAEFHMTRANISRITILSGVRADDTRRPTAKISVAEKYKHDLDLRAMSKYGFSREKVKEFQNDGSIKAFRNQKNSAKNRGITWALSFYEWVQIWVESGKFDLRGKGIGKYVMSRRGDAGPYEVGNVFVQSAVENSREATLQWKGKKKKNRGVFCMYPGRPRPWLAVSKGHSIGYFETEDAAVTARNSHIFNAQPIALGQNMC